MTWMIGFGLESGEVYALEAFAGQAERGQDFLVGNASRALSERGFGDFASLFFRDRLVS